MSWQKPARIGVAVVGLGSALAVYLAMGERSVAPPPKPVQRTDDKAILEISGAFLERFSGINKDFEIRDARMSFYEDGTVKLTGSTPGKPLTIIVHKGENRTFRVTAREAKVSKDENYFDLTGPVRLDDSDGFWLETETATVNRADAIAHVPGPATFGKGRMSGSGVGFSYDETRQVLLISQQARVKTVDAAGKTVMAFASETAMLDRLQHVLALDTGVHVVRNDQIIDTNHANGRLGPNNDVVTFVELHGDSRVSGGAPIEMLSARDISLDYTDDGKTLEAVKMAGNSSAAMAGEGGTSGRRFAGDTIDLGMAPDGNLTSAVARNAVRVDLPAAAGRPQQAITAQALDATGQAGKGLTALTFTTDVTFTEEPLRSKGPAAEKEGGTRTAHSQKLEAALTDDAVTAATFSGDVTFEETGLKACAAQAEYQPQKGSLALAGATKGGNPMVAEEQVAIEGQTIDVSLETRQMTARGDVRTWMRSPAVTRCKPSRQRPASAQGASNVPRLLKADAPVTIVASALAYESQTGRAVYSGGRTTLSQEDTSISADRLVIDQSKGDLTATGNVVSTLPLDEKRTRGLAHEIRYTDERRLIVYSGLPKTKTLDATLDSGPDSKLSAGNIEIILAASDNKLERMRARTNVRVVEGTHTVTGGASLDYTAADEKYVIRGTGATPVVLVTRDAKGCQQQSGSEISFNKGTDAVSVEGAFFLAQTKPACTAPPSVTPAPTTPPR